MEMSSRSAARRVVAMPEAAPETPDGAEGACEVPGKWLGGFPLVEAVADSLV